MSLEISPERASLYREILKNCRKAESDPVDEVKHMLLDNVDEQMLIQDDGSRFYRYFLQLFQIYQKTMLMAITDFGMPMPQYPHYRMFNIDIIQAYVDNGNGFTTSRCNYIISQVGNFVDEPTIIEVLQFCTDRGSKIIDNTMRAFCKNSIDIDIFYRFCELSSLNNPIALTYGLLPAYRYNFPEKIDILMEMGAKIEIFSSITRIEYLRDICERFKSLLSISDASAILQSCDIYRKFDGRGSALPPIEIYQKMIDLGADPVGLIVVAISDCRLEHYSKSRKAALADSYEHMEVHQLMDK